MDGTILYILIAAVTGLLGWGAVCLIQGFSDGSKRKLQDRLSMDDRIDAATTTRRSITVQQMEQSGLPPALANMPLFQGINKLLIQAFPDGRC